MTMTGLSLRALLIIALLLFAARAQAEEECQKLSPSARSSMTDVRRDEAPRRDFFDSKQQRLQWLGKMSARLKNVLPLNSVLRDTKTRVDFLRAVHYESSRAGLPPEIVMAVIHVESAFRKYAISSAGARGYMQVMPFWRECIGNREHGQLFHLRVNLRYGSAILRHYLDIENGDWFRALGRYNGSLGRAKYPNAVFAKYERHWKL